MAQSGGSRQRSTLVAFGAKRISTEPRLEKPDFLSTRPKKRRTYLPRIVGGKVMMPADLKRLHKYMLEVEHIDHISDEMRAVVEELWPEVPRTVPFSDPNSPEATGGGNIGYNRGLPDGGY